MVGFAGLVWLVVGRWRYGRLVRGVVGWSVAVGWLVVAEGGCVRIGSHSDRLVGRGGVMWRGLAVLCEDWLTR